MPLIFAMAKLLTDVNVSEIENAYELLRNARKGGMVPLELNREGKRIGALYRFTKRVPSNSYVITTRNFDEVLHKLQFED